MDPQDPRSLVGARLGDRAVPTPAAVLDRAVVQRNCRRMLAALDALRLAWRPHVKTHKIARLQVGARPLRVVVSTVLEAERLVPLVKEAEAEAEAEAKGRNPPGSEHPAILYGMPLYAAAVPRLAAVARALGGPHAVGVLVDHPDQVAVAEELAVAAAASSTGTAAAAAARPLPVFVKVDMGSRRAGVAPGSDRCRDVLQRLLSRSGGGGGGGGGIRLHGLYAHAGHSYDTRAPWAALAHLADEFAALRAVADEARLLLRSEGGEDVPPPPLVLSVGASPTAAMLQHPELGGAGGGTSQDEASAAAAAGLRATLAELAAAGFTLEVHAGVQPVLDLQQLATHAFWPAGAPRPTADLALTVLADVASVYPGRGAGAGGAGASAGDEALVNAGCLALGREPVKDVGGPGSPDGVYAGWGIVAAGNGSQALLSTAAPGAEFPRLPAANADRGYWQVGRISQEHGILTWAGAPSASASASAALVPGQRVRIWPNHACVAGAGFGYYVVVDSAGADPDAIVDVWERWNGW